MIPYNPYLIPASPQCQRHRLLVKIFIPVARLTLIHSPRRIKSQENHWDNASFHSAPEHSLSQDIDSLLNASDSSDDSNNLNATNFIMPTFQHHAHYHPPHEHFQVPSSYEGELQHVAASESHTFHSSLDVNVSGNINHHHRWVDPNNSYAGSSDAGSSYSNAPSSDTGR
ncbi:MAG: hypothetical protein BWK78_02335 [Thiotrichaceae bacterium IS1]|nr:MAG: hypothetical protein BWK78_02335 [Thiotrichaceae bacterium IS1]